MEGTLKIFLKKILLKTFNFKTLHVNPNLTQFQIQIFPPLLSKGHKKFQKVLKSKQTNKQTLSKPETNRNVVFLKRRMNYMKQTGTIPFNLS